MEKFKQISIQRERSLFLLFYFSAQLSSCRNPGPRQVFLAYFGKMVIAEMKVVCLGFEGLRWPEAGGFRTRKRGFGVQDCHG